MTTIDRTRFATGLTYDQYKEQMTRNRDRVEANEARVEIDREDLEAFRALKGPIHVLALAEDWCGDVIANLPVIGKLARESGSLDLRIFLRDQNTDLMRRYLNQGKYESIPVFAFFDDRFNELGVFIERPASVTERRAEQRKQIHAEHPEFGAYGSSLDALPEDVRAQLTAEITRRRDADVAWANREVVRALREIAERSPAAA
ncbi:MAG TPA: thioredoxin family protein [Candidatus Limnocylindria bacterium]|nr:thioredoxin family protein [Candidatus Limnocylindria bacterium]